MHGSVFISAYIANLCTSCCKALFKKKKKKETVDLFKILSLKLLVILHYADMFLIVYIACSVSTRKKI